MECGHRLPKEWTNVRGAIFEVAAEMFLEVVGGHDQR